MQVNNFFENVDTTGSAKNKATATETEDNIKKTQAEKTKADNEKYGAFLKISQEAKNISQKLLEEQFANNKNKENPYEDFAKLIEIANRISKGDVVPASDEKKLLEAEPDMYLQAKTTAMLNVNKKRKKHKALFKDEEKEKQEALNQLKIQDDFSDVEISEGIKPTGEGEE